MVTIDELYKFKSVQITPTKFHVSYELKQLLEHISKSSLLVECSAKQLSVITRNALNQVILKRFAPSISFLLIVHSGILPKRTAC